MTHPQHSLSPARFEFLVRSARSGDPRALEQLLHLARGHDPRAAAALWDLLEPWTTRRVRRRATSPDQAEELLARVRLRFLTRVAQLRAAGAARVWVEQLVRSAAADLAREEQHRVLASELDADKDATTELDRLEAAKHLGPEARLLSGCEAGEAWNLLLELHRRKPDHARAVVARDLLEIPYAELPGNEATWRSWRLRGLRWLRREAAGREGAGPPGEASADQPEELPEFQLTVSRFSPAERRCHAA